MYTIHSDGSVNTDFGIAGFDPTWSPDGNRIAYVDAINDVGISTVNANGSNPQQIYTGTLTPFFGWSPDSSNLAFEQNSELYTIPASGGTASLIYQDSSSSIDSVSWGYPYHAPASPSITSSSNVSGAVLSPFNFTVTTSGFPVPSITENGTLPNGIIFTDNGEGTGQLTGTPAVGTAGNYPITFTADNGDGNPANQNFTLTVNPTSAPSITSVNSDTETAGQQFSFTITTNGYPYPSIAKKGKLPGGVALTDNGNGTATLAGTPGAAADGLYPITLTAKNSVNTTTQSFTLAIQHKPVIKTASPPMGTTGQSYSYTFVTKGYTVPSLVLGGTLPDGLTFVDNGNGTGTLSGIPSTVDGSGSYALTLYATNQSGQTNKNVKININGAPWGFASNNQSFAPGQHQVATVQPYGYPNVTCTEQGALPTGITFNDDNCSFSGKAIIQEIGNHYTVTITATNSYGSTSEDFLVSVNYPT